MGPLFACFACGTKDAIALPSDGRPDVTCTACHRRQPRRPYEAQRLQNDPARPPAEQSTSGRPAWLVPVGVACAVGAIGLAGVVTVGSVLRSNPGPLMNAFAIVMSMIFCGTGVRAIQSPTTLRLAASQGHDAWGKNQYGPTQTATAQQGTRMGITFLVAGFGFLVLGIFFGRLMP